MALVFKQSALEVAAETESFENLTLATRAVRDERFDAIFIDASLPDFIPHEFLMFLRQTKFNSQAPLVLLTGYQAPGSAPRAGPAGAFLRLRATPEELRPFLRELRRKIGGERRKHRRLSFRTSVACIQGLRRFQATSVNLSSVGMLLEAASFLGWGEEFEVRFVLAAGDPPVIARARAGRVEGPNRLAITFQNLDVTLRQRLQKFLDAHLPALR
jgi:CheY-like chemotaxis protein